MAKAKPTIAGLTRQLAAQTALTDDMRGERDRFARALEREREAQQQLLAEANARENSVRDEAMRLLTENARLRGYLDRVEDTTPALPEPRYSSYAEQRRRTTGRGIEAAMYGTADAERHREWYHR